MDDDFEYEYDDDDEDTQLENKSHTGRRSRPKVKKNWSTGEILKLIRLVRTEACIWNGGDPGYFSKLLKKEAWSRVSAGFDDIFDDIELHAKWSNLRIQYRNTINQKKSKITWRFFEPLSFISETSIASPQNFTLKSTYNSSIEDSNDSALDVTSNSCTTTAIPVPITPASSSVPICRLKEPSLPMPATSSSLKRKASEYHSYSFDRDEALTTFLLSELRSLSQRDANILRCRLQRTLLEFNEEKQSHLAMDAVDIKYNSPL